MPGKLDVYTFSLASRARYYFDTLTNTPSVNWSLEGPAGVLVNNRQMASSDAGNYPVLLLEPGFYKLTVDGDGSVTNSYAFRFVDLAAASLIVPGTLVTNTLSPGAETDFYQFTSAAGDRLFFDRLTAPPSINLYWRLIDPSSANVSIRADSGRSTMPSSSSPNGIALQYSHGWQSRTRNRFGTIGVKWKLLRHPGV